MKINEPLVIWDLETTSAEVDTAEVIQFGGIKFIPKGRGQTTELKFLCKPRNPIEKDATEVNGISNEDVENEPVFKTFAKDVVEFFQDAVNIGYNHRHFDLPIIERELNECGFDDIFKDTVVLDTYMVFKNHNPRKLEDAMKFYSVNFRDKKLHDALFDADATFSIFKRQLQQEKKSVLDLAEEYDGLPHQRIGFSNHIKLNKNDQPFLTFGKNKDRLLKDINTGYLFWMLGSVFPVPVKNYIRKFMQ